jgi:glycosyltransferase involved in cell wall biosynthesis
MSNNVPVISICIPTHNGSKHIAETIKSVLNQTLQDFEIVISDNGSTDDTVQIIKNFNDPRITKIDCLEPVSPADNWNNAVQLASAGFIKLLCQDDVIFADCLEKEVKALSKPANLDCSFCFHTRNLITENGRHVWDPIKSSFRAGKYSISELLPRIVRSGGNPIGQPMAVTFRSESLKKTGPFIGEFVIDLDMWVKLLEKGDALALGEVLSAFRVNGDSWGIELSKKQFRMMYEFNLKMRAKHPNIVTRLDSEKGRLKCFIRTFARRFASRWVFRS